MRSSTARYSLYKILYNLTEEVSQLYSQVTAKLYCSQAILRFWVSKLERAPGEDGLFTTFVVQQTDDYASIAQNREHVIGWLWSRKRP